ncbi:MAG TPA: spore coat protein CotJB [Bacilli bacterium]
MGKLLDQESVHLMQELQAIDFTMQELSIYLQSHPNDSIVSLQYNELAGERRESIRRLEAQMWMNSSYLTRDDQENPEWDLVPMPWQIGS